MWLTRQLLEGALVTHVLHHVRVTHVWLVKLGRGHVTRVCIDNDPVEPIYLREKYPYYGITPHKKYISPTVYKRGFTLNNRRISAVS